ncbi:hypothetical protein OQA88_10760 [Cercophora sp. LCS_1]
MQFSLTTLLTIASGALANTITTAPGAIAEYNRIIDLVEAVRNAPTEVGAVTPRQCSALDPCCPDGATSCVKDMCQLSDNYPACLLGCCTACGFSGRYCS